MRYITVQEPITLRDEDGRPFTEVDHDDKTKTIDQKPVTHHAFLMRWVVSEGRITPGDPATRSVVPKIGAGYEGFKRTGKIDRAFAKAKPGEVVAIEDEDWKVVKAILEEHERLTPLAGAQLMPFFVAWIEASETKPANGITDIKPDTKPAPRRPSAA